MNIIYNITVAFKTRQKHFDNALQNNIFYLDEKQKFYFSTREEAERAMQSLRLAGFEVIALQFEDIIDPEEVVSIAKRYQEIMENSLNSHVAYIPKLFYETT